MIRLIRENAITDLRNILKNEVNFSEYPMADAKTGYYTREPSLYKRGGYRGKFVPGDTSASDALLKWIIETIKDKYNYDFNTNDLKLVKVAKPSGSTTAKKNPNYLIGINTSNGNAVLIGKGQFFEYFSGIMGRSSAGRYNSNGIPDNPEPDYEYKYRRVSLRDLWDTLDLWFEISPEDESTYRTRSEVRKAENRDELQRALRNIEMELYDVDYARERYAERVKVIKDRRKYESLLNQIEDINDRIRSIDFGHPIFGGGAEFDRRDIDDLRYSYNEAKRQIEKLSEGIEKSDSWDMNFYSKSLQKYYDEINTILNNRFGV
jgi:hypothetical protein